MKIRYEMRGWGAVCLHRLGRAPGVVLAVAMMLLGAMGCGHAGKGDGDSDAGHAGKDQGMILRYESGTEKGKRITLPDGTKIEMNAGTVIRINAEFGKGNRDVEFGGEAIFEVSGDAGKPFVVHTKNLQIFVLGTSFRVDAYPDRAGEEVDLLSGKLKVMKSYHSDTDNQPEVLQAGEMVMINREIDLMEKENFDPSEEKKWGVQPSSSAKVSR